MKNKKIITEKAKQLKIDFESKNFDVVSNLKYFSFDQKICDANSSHSIIISINDCIQDIKEKKNKQIVDYIINNAKRF